MTMNGILWQTTHSGKMTGIASISTSCADNPFCVKRRENGNSVCSHCYANTYMKMRKALRARLEGNLEILTSRVLEDQELPVINSEVFRFESFGDIVNVIHLANYVNIAYKNPQTRFALYTKNTWILDEFFNKNNIEKPANLIIVVSSPRLNKPIKLDKEKFWFVDHVFTVYDRDYVKSGSVEINCGAKSCIDCQICYHRDTEYSVSEKLK